ncbi:MAG: putative toxin-antitoxin system toxin component, PIN family [Steroidobacteraceae bacterium]
MRIVADTNTVLSGLLWQGPPRRLLDLARARERKVSLYTSVTLLAELAEVIARDKFAERVRAAGLSAAELVQDYERLAEVVTPETLPAPVSRDPDDDHVLACAVAAKAELIVSGDKRHLLVLGEYQGIPIRTVSDALGQLTAPAPPRK